MKRVNFSLKAMLFISLLGLFTLNSSIKANLTKEKKQVMITHFKKQIEKEKEIRGRYLFENAQYPFKNKNEDCLTNRINWYLNENYSEINFKINKNTERLINLYLISINIAINTDQDVNKIDLSEIVNNSFEPDFYEKHKGWIDNLDVEVVIPWLKEQMDKFK